MALSGPAARRAIDHLPPAYDRIAKRIGGKLRELYGSPEGQPLPADHVDLLLRLRHKERDRARQAGP